jgi:serine/threonine-protein kinase
MFGERLNDRYHVEAVVWSGTMSNVYRATDELNHRTVAVKALLHVFADNILYRSRYEREAHILRQVRHPHIVPYIDHFQEGANFYLVMEYMGGGNLYDRLVTDGALSIPETRQLLLGITDALHTLHRHHIIHRDLKPENILLNMQGKPFLCDFGEAYTVGNNSPLGHLNPDDQNSTNDPTLNAIAGTAYYAAPETWDGHPQNAQSDIWALGVMMFEMLTGEVPFRGTTVEEVKQKIQTEPLPDIRQSCPDLPDGLAQILAKSLDKQTTTRYPTVRAFHNDVKRGKPARLTMTTEAIVAILVLLLLCVVVLSYVFLGDDSMNDSSAPDITTNQPTDQFGSFFGG